MSARRLRRSTPMRIAAACAGLSAILLAPALVDAGATEAAWLDSEHATSSTSAGFLAPVVKTGTCSVALLGANATVNWTNPSTGVARTGIVWGLYTTPGGVLVGTETATSGAGAPTSTSLTVPGSPSGVTAGTYSLHVQTYAGSWRSPVVTGTIRFTTGILGTAIAECTWTP